MRPENAVSLAAQMVRELSQIEPALSMRGMGVVFRIAAEACNAQVNAEQEQRMAELMERRVRLGQG